MSDWGQRGSRTALKHIKGKRQRKRPHDQDVDRRVRAPGGGNLCRVDTTHLKQIRRKPGGVPPQGVVVARSRGAVDHELTRGRDCARHCQVFTGRAVLLNFIY